MNGTDALMAILETRRPSATTVRISAAPRLGWRLVAAAATQTGSARKENEDRHVLEMLRDGSLLAAVADGMGGHAAGGRAATLAVDALAATVATSRHPHAALDAGFVAAGRAIREAEFGATVVGTTLVAAVISADLVTVASVGDSRAYVVRGRSFRQLTEDHTWGAEASAVGRPDLLDADRRHVLVRAVTGAEVAVDLTARRIRAGEVIVVCTDGIWKVLDGELIAGFFDGDGELHEQAAHAARGAVIAGTHDDATIVACRLEPAA